MKIFFKLFLLVSLLALTCACENDKAPAGVVATVNGEPITLLAVQAMMDSRSPTAGVPPRPSLEDMRKNYSRALVILIANTLARQELAARGMEVEPEAVEETVREIRGDYGENGLDQYLEESFIREADWKQQILDYLSLRAFKNEILLPAISVSLEEIKDYYNKHEKEFYLPDNMLVCFLTADSSKAITDWSVDMDIQKSFPGLNAECLYATSEEIPESWRKEAREMKAGATARPRQEDGVWRSLAILEKNSGKKLSTAQAYALIENILEEEKGKDAFDSWLEKKLSESRIKITPELAGMFKVEPSGEREVENGENGK